MLWQAVWCLWSTRRFLPLKLTRTRRLPVLRRHLVLTWLIQRLPFQLSGHKRLVQLGRRRHLAASKAFRPLQAFPWYLRRTRAWTCCGEADTLGRLQYRSRTVLRPRRLWLSHGRTRDGIQR